jgi:hypothetical protein
MENPALDPCLLDILTLEHDMCHLELEHSTCGPILCKVMLLVED